MTKFNLRSKESAMLETRRIVDSMRNIALLVAPRVSFRAQYFFFAHDHFVSSDRLKKFVPPGGWLLTHLRNYRIVSLATRYWTTKSHSLGSNPAQCTTTGWNGQGAIFRVATTCRMRQRKADSKCIDINILRNSTKDRRLFLILLRGLQKFSKEKFLLERNNDFIIRKIYFSWTSKQLVIQNPSCIFLI